MSNTSSQSYSALSQPSSTKPEETSTAQSEEVSDSRSTGEKISFFIALAILFSVLCGVGYLWNQGEEDPSVLETAVESVEKRGSSYYLPFTVKNEGDRTAAAVQVIAELQINNEIVEWGEQEIAFLSRQEEVQGAFVFERNPSEGLLTVRVASYLEP